MKLEPHEQKHLDLLYPHLGECTLFLKKNDEFPLSKPCKIAVFGNGVRYTIKGGTGSGEVNSRFFINVEEGLKQTGFEVTTTDWLNKFDEILENSRKKWIKEAKMEARKAHAIPAVYCMGMIMPTPDYDIPLTFEGDVAIYVVSRISGEGNDRRARKGDVLLTDSEVRDILELNKRFKKFMLVINAGGVIDLEPVLEVSNILVLSELGSETGKALGDILLGKLNPSGKLTATWAKLDDYPYSLIFDKDDTLYTDGEYVGYRYFDSFDKKPFFPFGYGLSYSSFKLDNFKVTNKKSNINVKVDVTNISNYEGQEVVQVYISKVNGEIYQELINFEKTPVIPCNEKVEVNISFNLADLTKYNEERQCYLLDKGEYLIRVGNSSDNTQVVGKIVLKDEVITKQVKNMFNKIEIDEIRPEASLNKEIVDVPTIELSRGDFNIKEYRPIPPFVEHKIDTLTDEQLAMMSVGYFTHGVKSVIGSSCKSLPGAAGQTPSLYKELFNVEINMPDGPAGLRVCPRYYIDKKGNAIEMNDNKIIDDVAQFFPKPIAAIVRRFFVKGKQPKKGEKVYFQWCTALPIGTAIAQTWNKDFARLCGDIVGTEMEIFNANLWLAPALNLQKNILCGRNFEYYSEDPLLSGIIATQTTMGVQSHNGKGVTIKHFAANNQETNRYASNSVITEKTLRDMYLKGFEYCINHSQPRAIMSSYNLINGVHTSENRQLMNDFLFIENAFEGFIMTDWVLQMTKSKNDKYPFPRASKVAMSGTSLMMPGSKTDMNDVLKALKNNDELRHQIRINIARIVK